MQDKETIQQILGLTSPWTVSEVKLDMPSQEIRVRVEHPRGTMFCCPECKKQLSVMTMARSVSGGTWTHASSKPSSLVAFPSRVPRAWREVGRCPLGRTAQSIHHHVRAFRDRSIADDSDGQRSDDILRLLWDATWNIIERAVKRGKARKEPSLLPRIGIDEKAFSKGQKYVSILYNIDNSTVEAIQEGHDVDAQKLVFPS